jgi:low temperature requirement protein LtrA
MTGRDPHEAHRASTPLELLFDLCFVVAIAASASQLHHAVAENHVPQGLVGFALVFVAVWWAWMQFTWFASAYDTDDASYRLWTMVQMLGALVLAAGVPKASHGDLGTVTIGYAVMRVGMVAMWLRVMREHPERRATALRYAVAIAVLQAGWLARLVLPETWGWPTYVVLIVGELAAPVWAARAGRTPWHPHQISERYGLFTIIVIGEVVLAATNAIAGVLGASGWSWQVIVVGLATTALVLALWWIYFMVPFGEHLHRDRSRAFRWGYGHLPLFASLAALGGFLEAAADQLKAGDRPGAAVGADHAGTAATHLTSTALVAGLVAAAIAVYLICLWWLSARVAGHRWPAPGAFGIALVVLAAGFAAVAWGGLSLPAAMTIMPLAPAIVIAANSRVRAVAHRATSGSGAA